MNPSMREAVALAGGTLFRIGTPLALDGRLTWYPRPARGYAPANVYLLVDGSSGLLVDTGLPAFENDIVGQLRSLVGDGVTELSVLPTRAAEFDSIGNVAAIISGLGIRHVYSQSMDIHTVIAFQPRFDLPPAASDTSWFLDELTDWRIFEPGDVLEWTPGRTIEIVRTPFRLLITVWGYDPVSRTLFTSDAFNHVTRATADESPIVTESDHDSTSVDDVIGHFDSGKFDWLAKADTSTIAKGIEAIFATHEVDRIAPSFGCVLEGRAVVERHVGLLLQALERMSVGTAAGRP